MRFLTTPIDGLSWILSRVSMVMLAVLVTAMLYEVFARYVMGSPTMWAFDISYMLNGSLFLLASGYTLQRDAHVRIDFLSQRFPARVQAAVNAAAYLLCLLPIFATLTEIAAGKAWKAYVTGEVEAVSPWAPLVWPFYSAIAIGLLGLTLQLLADGLRFARQIAPGSGNAEAVE